MKKSISIFFFLAILLASTCPSFAQSPVKLTNQLDSASYGLGILIASNMKQQGITQLNTALIQKGLDEVFSGQQTALTPESAQELMMAMMQAVTQKAGAANKAACINFLEENKKRAGVTTTASGLQYEVMKPGTGPKPTGPESTVKVHYHGMLIDGTVFDSSVERGEPIEFPLNGVIPGWTEGVQLMNVGSKFKFFIPEGLAYGANSPPGSPIKPYSALIFEVELLEVK